MSRHYETKHAKKYRHLTESEKVRILKDMLAKLREQQGYFTKLHAARNTKTSFIFHKIAKNYKPLSEGEFEKEHLVDSATLIRTEKKEAFEKVSLSMGTMTGRVEDIAQCFQLQLKSGVGSFDFVSSALDESCDVRDMAQFLVFFRGITQEFKITKKLAGVRSMKGTTTGSELFNEVNACMDTLELKWERLVGVTIDGCPNLTGKNAELLKQMQDKVTKLDTELKLVFNHCIIHQHALCNSALKLNNAVDVVTKTANFIRARALNHRPFVAFLKEQDNKHVDIRYHTAVRWLSLGKSIKKIFGPKSRD